MNKLRVSDEDIYAYFFGDQDISGNIHSPLRDDANPSFKLFVKEDGTITWYDFGYGKACGVNAIHLVMEYFSCDYGMAIKIANSVIAGSDKKGITVRRSLGVRTKSDPPEITWREGFLQRELDFWAKFGIDEKTLVLFGVKAIHKIRWGNNKTPTYSKPNDLIFGWTSGESFKVYRPFRKKGKWYSKVDGSPVIGMSKFTKDKPCFILSSLKDQMCVSKFTYNSLSPFGSESNLGCWKKYRDDIKLKSSRQVVLYDGDFTGWTTTLKVMTVLDCEGICTMPYFNTLPHIVPGEKVVKDFGEVVEHFGTQALTTVMREIASDIKTNTYRYADTTLHKVSLLIARGVFNNDAKIKIPFALTDEDRLSLTLRKVKMDGDFILLKQKKQ